MSNTTAPPQFDPNDTATTLAAIRPDAPPEYTRLVRQALLVLAIDRVDLNGAIGDEPFRALWRASGDGVWTSGHTSMVAWRLHAPAAAQAAAVKVDDEDQADEVEQ